MNDVKLIQNDDGTFSWYCDHCGIEHTVHRSFVGQVKCPCCQRTSFVDEVIR